MRLLITTLLCLISVSIFGQSSLPDTLVKLNNYTVNYSQYFLQPIEVWYQVKCPYSLKINCSINWNSFEGILTSENEIHYENNNWDRGHMAPAASLDCSCEQKQETYSYINCALQNNTLNKSVWRTLENRERTFALKQDVFVYIKVEFNDTTRINGARIPSGFFKTLVIDGVAESYYFPNSTPETKNLSDYMLK